MAQTYENNTHVLSKVQLGENIYYLKDAAARKIMDTFGDVVTFDKATSVTADGTGVVDAALMYDYVGRQIGAIGQALNLLSESDHTKVAKPQSGDFVVEADGKEWLYDGEEWRVVGDESSYVLKTTKVAGIDLADDITKAELQQALELGALAYLNSGSVKVTTPDSYNSFSTGKAGEYDVVASKVSVPATYNALDVTPAGSVAIEPGIAAAASYDKTTSVTVATATPAAEQSPTYTPAGSVSVDSVTVNSTDASVATVTDAGTEYQLTKGSCVKGSDTKSAFATAGVIASIDESDKEMLVFTNASTADAVTASGDVTYTDPTLSGSLPTFGSQTVVGSITGASGSASFSGTGVMINASPAYTSTQATVTQPTFTGSFSGTSKSVTPVVATTVSAAGTDGKVTVASETITPSAKSSEKTVAVDFA